MKYEEKLNQRWERVKGEVIGEGGRGMEKV